MNELTWPLRAAAALALTGVGSCRAVATYGKERGADLVDCFALVVAPGTAAPVSAAAGIELTRYLPLGLGVSSGDAFGSVGRRPGAFDYDLKNPSLILEWIDSVFDRDDYPGDVISEDVSFVTELRPRNLNSRNPGRDYRLGVNVGLSVLFVYADVELGEVLDFTLGIFGLDIMRDDSPRLELDLE